MINCNDLAVDFGSRYLFKDVQLNLLARNRYAIVGANGSGKSTFLKLLADEEQPSSGVIDRPKKITIGLLKQDHFRYRDQRVIDVVIEGKPELARAFQAKERILSQIDISEPELYQLAELEETILAFNGYTAESEAQKILIGLGIPQDSHHAPLSTLAGGYKLRVLLAQALFQDPDVLLLDEPTNHLDIISIAWLEFFLVNNYKGLLLFVSHDRQFINNSSTHILDVDYETITLYYGNYESFLDKKAAVLEQMQKEVAHKQDQIASMQQFVDRFRASATKAKQAQSRLKMIERIELPDAKNTSRIQPHFHFIQRRPAGKHVLQVKGLSKAFAEKTLFTDLSFNLHRGQKCAIIGANGVGKSTLLKILLQQLVADSGQFTWNDILSIGYFAQDFRDLLDPTKTALQWLCEQMSGVSEQLCRKALGQMLFSGKDADKMIKVLSGGECARLIFAKLILEQHNVLIFDEPTNHLDLETIDGLSEGLRQFPGTVLCVSHNRYFVQNIASSLLVMKGNRVEMYLGTYQEYLDKMGHDYLMS